MASAALGATALVATGIAPASADQASGEDVPAWSTGWSWTYATTFKYDDGAGTNASVNEAVTYTNLGRTTFNGQDAYRLKITGNITGGGGKANAGGVSATLDGFGGTVSGTRYVRASDLALLQEQQTQHLTGKASALFLSVGITADINLTLTPSPGWRTHDFPLNAGDSWHNNETVAYTGGFAYDAGSIGSGSSPFDGSFPFDATSSVSSENISVPIGSVSTKAIAASATTPDGKVVDNIWWSAQHKNDAKEHMELPLDGATLTIDRNLTSASTPAPSTSLTTTLTPSLTCAGGEVTVSGKLGNTSGVPVSVVLDKSQVNPGQKVTASTTTTANGSYSTTLTAPTEADGLGKNGSRANWGVLVSGGGATGATTLVVTPVDCTTLTYTGATSSPRGTDATVSAKLVDLGGGSAANRQVTFSLAGGASRSATTDGSGVASTTLPVGDTARNTTLTASFAGNATMQAASTSTAFTVTRIGTTTSVSPSVPSVDVDDQISFTADVSAGLASVGSPDGAVQFKIDGADFGSPVTLSEGSATSAAISTLAQGNHTVQAVYLGSAGFVGSSSDEVSFAVTPPHIASQTSLTVSPASAVHGQPVTLSAKVTGAAETPTGSVTFKSGANALGTVALDESGTAELTTTELPVGGPSVVATYSGDDTYKASASPGKSVTVAKADTDAVLTASKDATVTGEPVSYSVSVQPVAPGAGTPSGAVQLQVDGLPAGDPVQLIGGSASFPPITTLGAGNHTIGVSYAGDAGFNGDTDSLTQTVGQAATTTTLVVSPSPSQEGQLVTLTAAVVATAPGSGHPTGTVTFTSDGVTVGTAPVATGDSGDRAVLQLDDLEPGDHSIAATYAGDADYAASASEPVDTNVLEAAAVVGTTTTLTSSLNPSTYGQLISFTAAVVPDDGSTPAGAVQFSMDGLPIGDPVPVNSDGVAVSPVLGSPDPGDHTVLASFVGDVGYAGSGDTLVQTVAGADVAVTLTSSEASSDYGQPVTFTAEVGSMQSGTGAPTGSVQFRVDGQAVGGAVEVTGGKAVSQPVTDLEPGDHAVSALYSGDAHFVPRTVSITQAVAKVGTTTRLDTSTTSATYGGAVTLGATVTPASTALGAPAGTVAFKDGAKTLATVPVQPAGTNGTASVTVADLDAGSHAITAVYSGTDLFAASSSAPEPVEVAKQVTYLKADAAVVKLLPLGLPLGQLRATLRTADGPMAGAPVVFTIHDKQVCTVTTDQTGVAVCDARKNLLELLLFNGYTATYAGDANHQPSSGRGFNLK